MQRLDVMRSFDVASFCSASVASGMGRLRTAAREM
jgi:hypothetical protein